MIFAEGRSALVRLSDGIKSGLLDCQETAEQLLALYHKVFPNGRPVSTADALELSREDAILGVALQGKLHTRSLTTIVTTCFCIESYINSLSYFLLKERDLFGLIRGGYGSTAELLFDSVEKLSTPEKWDTVAKSKGGSGFDRSRAPFQHLKYLFNFRNDVVHDKVGEYGITPSKDRYGSKLTDPALGLLQLDHVLFAATTYWSMAEAIHEMIDLPAREFRRHYNLSPWTNDQMHKDLREVALAYRGVLPG